MNHNERVIYRALLTIVLMPFTIIGWLAVIPMLLLLLAMEESHLKSEIEDHVLGFWCFGQFIARKIIPEPKEEG